MDGQTQAAWEVPDIYAAGWHESSAPLGVLGNTVLNGHNTTNGEVFRDLYTLAAGDTIVAYSGNTPYTYAVTEILILPEAGQPLEVRLENARYILPTDDDRLTLVTCHPYGSLRNRLIVIAHPKTMTSDQVIK
jgi:LPXTG-site transpeptidase (sortase) family protein